MLIKGKKMKIKILLLTLVIIIVSGCYQSSIPNPVMPNSVFEIRSYLQEFIPEKYNNSADFKVNTNRDNEGNYAINIELYTDNMYKNDYRYYARNLIFATYKAKYEADYPVYYVSVSIYSRDKNKPFFIGIGSNVMSKIERSTIKNFSMKPNDFLVFLSDNYNQGITNEITDLSKKCVVDERI